MSDIDKGQTLAVFQKNVFVTSARTADKPHGSAQVHLRYQAQGANLVIAMAAADAEAVAEELVHAAACARDRDARRTTRGPAC